MEYLLPCHGYRISPPILSLLDDHRFGLLYDHGYSSDLCLRLGDKSSVEAVQSQSGNREGNALSVCRLLQALHHRFQLCTLAGPGDDEVIWEGGLSSPPICRH